MLPVLSLQGRNRSLIIGEILDPDAFEGGGAVEIVMVFDGTTCTQ
jgi:hypothetical protein